MLEACGWAKVDAVALLMGDPLASLARAISLPLIAGELAGTRMTGWLSTDRVADLNAQLNLIVRRPDNAVRGVVEATGELLSFNDEGDAIIARYRAPPDILRHTVVKGPITVDGVSLTVIAKNSDSFNVSLVTFTQEHTNLTRKKPGDTVNLESDIIARYVDQLLSERT